MKYVPISNFQPDLNQIYTFEAPSSKSILNRALLLAAFSKGDVLVACNTFGEDSVTLLRCLSSLGIVYEKHAEGILVHGCGGIVPCQKARIDVCSAGTCARFLPAILTVTGGDYSFVASEQMKQRPMDYLPSLEKAGAKIEYGEQINRFPFRLRSDGFRRHEISVSTDTSTQYASALLLAGAISKTAFSVKLTGARTQGGYIKMTLSLLNAFGAEWRREHDTIKVFPAKKTPSRYEVEADVSAACYFYALALLFGIKVLVRRIKKNSLQSDAQFFDLLNDRGVRFTETDEGLLADGNGITAYQGFRENLRDFSDQALTVAALAPFASSSTRLTGINHIRSQECDRIAAIEKNLSAIGVPCRAGKDFVEIEPAVPKSGAIDTFDDHRVAMAFTLTALRSGNLEIDNPECCKKSFGSFFEEIEKFSRNNNTRR